MKCKCCGKEAILVPKICVGLRNDICLEDEWTVLCIGDEEE